MNKAELIDRIADEAGISRSQANSAMDAFTGAVSEALAGGDRVTLVGFGTFSVSDRAARNGRNPQTGATIKIAARRVARFKPGKEFSDSLSGSKSKKAASKSSGGSKSAPAKSAGASKGAGAGTKGAAASKGASTKGTAARKR